MFIHTFTGKKEEEEERASRMMLLFLGITNVRKPGLCRFPSIALLLLLRKSALCTDLQV